MKRLPNQTECIGCGICLEVCPTNCLSFFENAEGFRQIKSEEDLCIKCNKCERYCPVLQDGKSDNYDKEEISVYACQHIDKEILKNSSSGGFFSALCEALFNLYQGKVTVYGASLQKDLTVKHIGVSFMEELSLIRGSKYLQSDITSVLTSIKERLQNGEFVLFSGTPCQIAALYSFLKDSYPTLFTCEVICHGIPSDLHFRKQNEDLEAKVGASISSINFRSKSICWTIPTTQYCFSNGKVRYYRALENNFMGSFYSGINLRPSCYGCKYAKLPRLADITMGDFWKIGESACFSFMDKEKGISLALCNNTKGKFLFESAKYLLKFEPRKIEEAIRGNVHLIQPVKNKSIQRECLLSDIKLLEMDKVAKKYNKISFRKRLSMIMGRRGMKAYYYLKNIRHIK
ncbi:Coenzyme F420 hydrogenase/dehydrogenase, beta subunit C-terminal domain [Parabacteroides chinchillae]|uniref:Coenzyme F420-reducing hydrogenase, beta subunit n=1 Tax=Parabacteroides chinchillae TaxID=871327 RepID=A0A8G2BTY5_9BACT|nr:Coenzyme F420 hydrogenase/dehydrogenase, beta subunit C-terminal domain [Parabacteroides chinchillae]SEF46405.1 Coenzyme F420-reducing hydrogenase, beta subunit [Parabacteroides chinchillae]